MNKVRPEQVQEAFSPYFEILRVVGLSWDHYIQGKDEGFRYEAEELLSEELRERLSAYPRELLLTVCYLIQARKT